MSYPVSVICCTYNRPELLSRALSSLQKQNTRDFEVIVVNDGGIDVGDIVKKELSDVPYQYHSLQKNVGLPAAISYAIEQSQGRYLMYIDDDNEYLPNHVRKLYQTISSSGAYLAYSDSRWRYYEGNTVVKDETWKWDYSHNLLNFQNYIDPVQVIVDRQRLLSVGGWDKEFRVPPDWDMWLRLRTEKPFIHVPEVNCIYGIYKKVDRLSGSTNTFLPFADLMVKKYSATEDKFLQEAAACLSFIYFGNMQAMDIISRENIDPSSLTQTTLTGMILLKSGEITKAKKIFYEAFEKSVELDPPFKLFIADKLLNILTLREINELLENIFSGSKINASLMTSHLANAYIESFSRYRLPSKAIAILNEKLSSQEKRRRALGLALNYVNEK